MNQEIKKETRGRKPRSHKIDLEQLTLMASRGLTKDQCCNCLGIPSRTFYKMQAENPEIENAYNIGRSSGVKKIANALFDKALNGDTTSMIFYLKAQGGWRDTAQIELTGSATVNVDSVRTKLLDALEKHNKNASVQREDTKT